MIQSHRSPRRLARRTIILPILMIFAVSIASCGPGASAPRAEGGVLDTERWDFGKNGPVSLDGEWEFYWNRLLSPGDFTPPRTPDTFIQVPGTWNGTEIPGVGRITGKGYATYRLTVKIGGNARNLGLKILDAATSYRLWVNGIPVASNGIVGVSPSATRPQYLPLIVSIPGPAMERAADGGRLELVVQAANFSHRRGGLWESIKLGTYRDIAEIREHGVAMTFFIAGVIFIMGLYHLGLYLLRRKETATLHFAMLSLLMSLRSVIINDRILIHWFPEMPWKLLVSLEYLTAYCNIVIIALFIGALYGEELKKGPVRLITAVGLVFAAIFIFLNVGFFALFKPAYDLFVLLGGGYVIFCLAKSTVKKRDGAWIALGGMTALYLSGINDVLYNAQIINTTNLAPLGLFIYILSQSQLLSRRFNRAMDSVEKLGCELADLNMNLEKKVNERTEELRAAFEEMEAMNDQLVEAQNIIQSELELARRIQNQLIPQRDPDNFSITSHYLPMELVGGDFFDYIHFREHDRLGIFLSDVSGHGVPAALITSMMKSFILKAGSRKESPAFLLDYLNENISAYTGGNFITAFYCIYDGKSKKLTYSNAGHHPPVLMAPGAVTHLKSAKSVPLGIMAAAELERRGKSYADCEIDIEEGSRLLLYTDGLTDVQKHDDPSIYFGDWMFFDYIKDNAVLQHSDFVYGLMREVKDFKGRDAYKDDICVICIDL